MNILKVRIFQLVLILLCMNSNFCHSSEWAYSINDLPKFQNFLIEPSENQDNSIKKGNNKQLNQNNKQPLSFKSNPAAKKFKSLLTKEAKKQANFAENYIVISTGCGTMCQQNWIINKKTGKILGPIGSEMGVSYQVNSRLLITNPLDSLSADEIEVNKNWMKTEYYVLREDEISKVFSIPTVKLAKTGTGSDPKSSLP